MSGRMTRRRVVGSIICLVAAVGLYFVLRPAPEPTYQGKALSEWVEEIAKSRFYGQRTAWEPNYREAIQHMHTEALPFLLKWLREDPTVGLRRFLRVRSWLPPFLQTSRLVTRIERRLAAHQRDPNYRAAGSEGALILLGKDARPAVPALLRMFSSTSPSYYGSYYGFHVYRAGNVLTGLGKEALPEVLAALSDPRCGNRVGLALVVSGMQGIGESAAPAVPIICNNLQQTNTALRMDCVQALGNLALMPELAIPALIGVLTNALGNNGVMFSRKCIEAIARFGVRGAKAVPALCNALKSPDGITTEEAAVALGKIGAHAPMAVPALIAYLKDGGARHRKYAIEGLRGYADDAQEAIPLIKEALKDEDHDTRAMAEDALRRMTPNL
jgi:HEAT repeat protein